jgi:hypothetical protein
MARRDRRTPSRYSTRTLIDDVSPHTSHRYVSTRKLT